MKTKITKEYAHYRDSGMGIQRCGNCSMFIKPHGCTLVKGIIQAKGWCREWEKKGTTHV